MKARIQIPKGWRRLEEGELTKRGDRFLRGSRCEWALVRCYPHNPLPAWPTIRRIKKRKGAK
jgi:hypothetical protein